MTAAIVLTLILNAQQPFIASPITVSVADDGTQQIAIPVRAVFEAAGYTVQYREYGGRTVAISGYVDRLTVDRRLVRMGALSLDRPEVHCGEYVGALPFSVQNVNGVLYAPAIVLRIIAGGDLSADMEAGTLRWDTCAPEQAPNLAIGDVIADLPRWLHRRVQVAGAVLGPEGDPSRAATSTGPPAPGAWAGADGTGAIYCTDVLALPTMAVQDPGLARGQRVAVNGIVRPGWGGLPYLSQARATAL